MSLIEFIQCILGFTCIGLTILLIVLFLKSR